MSEMDEDRDEILNPQAVGDPNQTPIVQLSAGAAAYFERTRCPECRLINHFHEPHCSRACCCETSPPEFGGMLPVRECPIHAEVTP